MTFQVGCVGCDGVVLASDRCVIERDRNAGTRTSSLTDKICYSQELDWAYCCAGGDSTVSAMRLFFDKNQSAIQNETNIAQKLTLCGQVALQSDPAKRKDDPSFLGSVLFVRTVESSVELWKLHVNCPAHACRIYDKSVQGDDGNTARFITQKYFQAGKTVRELVPLAAHAVLVAHELNPEGIDGLDVLICIASKFEKISSKEIAGLTKWSQGLDGRLSNILLDRQLGAL